MDFSNVALLVSQWVLSLSLKECLMVASATLWLVSWVIDMNT